MRHAHHGGVTASFFGFFKLGSSWHAARLPHFAHDHGAFVESVRLKPAWVLRAGAIEYAAIDLQKSELHSAGLHRIEQLNHEQLNQRYFNNRAHGLKLSFVKLALLTGAWV
jgi:hypothetical protein